MSHMDDVIDMVMSTFEAMISTVTIGFCITKSWKFESRSILKLQYKSMKLDPPFKFLNRRIVFNFKEG